jgi:mannosyltransferase
VTASSITRRAMETRTASVARSRGVVATVLGPALLALLLSLAWSGRPSYWLDETATVSAVGRPFPDLLRALRHIDAVHGAYYALLWPWAQISIGEVWLRSTSALAAAGATAAVVGIAWHLFDQRTALVSGLLYATLPVVSYDGSNIRSQALDVMLAAAATFFLLQASRTGRTRWFVAYSLVMATAVTVFLFTALVLVAQAAYMLMSPRRRTSLAALVLPLLATIVVGAATYGQAGQVSQIERPTLRGLPRFVMQAWFSDSIVLTILVCALAVGGAVLMLRRHAARSADAVLLFLLVLAPTGLLWVVSQIHPLLVDRYVAAGAVSIVILASYALSAVRWRAVAAVAAVAVMAAGIPAQVAQRQPNGRGADYRDDPRDALATVRADHRPGDVISYDGGYTQGAGYSYPNLVRGLPDITLGTSRIDAENLYGYQATPAQIAQRLVGVHRVWLLTYTSRTRTGGAAEVALLRADGFHRAYLHDYGRTSVSLYAR